MILYSLINYLRRVSTFRLVNNMLCQKLVFSEFIMSKDNRRVIPVTFVADFNLSC